MKEFWYYKMDNDISKVYLITDTHFFHIKMQEYCQRPLNFNTLIIDKWKSIVKVQDLVYHLGDVIWGNLDQLSLIMKELPGTKILIRGNHDKHHSDNFFIRSGFSAVLDQVRIKKIIIFSHFPVELSQKEIGDGLINIHGHFHNNPSERWEKELKSRITEHHFLLSLEDVNYCPVSLSSVMGGKNIKSTKSLIKEG
jgi:calcineurin-like phosphoesterase family protein